MKITRTVRTFAEIQDLIALETTEPANAFDTAFASDHEGYTISRDDDAIPPEMPDEEQVQLAIELMVTTLFDVLRDTHLTAAANRIAWGVVHSLHREASRWSDRADTAAHEMRELLRSADGSEVHSITLEVAQRQLTILDEGSDALACMRDHAAAVYHNETGRPWSAPRATLTSSKRTASVIDGLDYLAARRQRRIGQHHPDGPLVAFSGGHQWSEYKPIFKALDDAKATRPTMVLLTTAQTAGADAIAEAWAARTKTPIVKLGINRARWGDRAGFVRNDQIARLQPVDAIIAEGSGVQEQLIRVMRSIGVEPMLLARHAGKARRAKAR